MPDKNSEITPRVMAGEIAGAPDPALDAPAPLLHVNVYAKMAVKAGVTRVDARYIGTFVENPRDSCWVKTERLQAAKRARKSNALSDLELMARADRIEFFIEEFRKDPDLVSGLSAFNQLVGRQRDRPDAALVGEWEIVREDLKRESAIEP